MTFARIKAVGWQVNEKVTSAQLNQLDLDHSKSLDKTGDNAGNGGGISGEIDVLSGGLLQVNSGGFINIQSGGGVNFFGASSETFNNTSGITFNNTAGISFAGTGNLIIGSGASFLSAGTANITSGGTLGINSGATEHVKSGATLFIDSGGTEQVSSGGVVSVQGGANVNYASGANLNMNGGSFLNLTDNTILMTKTSGPGIFTVGSQCLVDWLSGSFLTASSGSTTNIHGTFKTDSWPSWNTPITRQSCMRIDHGAVAQGAANWLNIGTGLQNTNGSNPQIIGQQTLEIPLTRLHNGATLASVFIAFFVGTSHSGVPQNLPTFTVFRYQSLGGGGPTNVQYLSTIAVQSPTNPGSGSAWYDSGNVQYYQYVTNQNNVIDNTTWLYGMSVADESGTNSLGGNAYLTVTAENQIINDLSWNI